MSPGFLLFFLSRLVTCHVGDVVAVVVLWETEHVCVSQGCVWHLTRDIPYLHPGVKASDWANKCPLFGCFRNGVRIRRQRNLGVDSIYSSLILIPCTQAGLKDSASSRVALVISIVCTRICANNFNSYHEPEHIHQAVIWPTLSSLWTWIVIRVHLHSNVFHAPIAKRVIVVLSTSGLSITF